MLAIMMAWPIDRAPLPIEVPKLHIAAALREQSVEEHYINARGPLFPDMRCRRRVTPIGHIVGTDTEREAICQGGGAAKDD